jgi:hypothetical protein
MLVDTFLPVASGNSRANPGVSKGYGRQEEFELLKCKMSRHVDKTAHGLLRPVEKGRIYTIQYFENGPTFIATAAGPRRGV